MNGFFFIITDFLETFAKNGVLTPNRSKASYVIVIVLRGAPVHCAWKYNNNNNQWICVSIANEKKSRKKIYTKSNLWKRARRSNHIEMLFGRKMLSRHILHFIHLHGMKHEAWSHSENIRVTPISIRFKRTFNHIFALFYENAEHTHHTYTYITHHT